MKWKPAGRNKQNCTHSKLSPRPSSTTPPRATASAPVSADSTSSTGRDRPSSQSCWAPSTRPRTGLPATAAVLRRGLPQARCLSAASAAPHHRRAADDPRWRRGLPLVLGLHTTGGTRRPLRRVRHDAAVADGGGGLLLPRILTHLPMDMIAGWLGWLPELPALVCSAVQCRCACACACARAVAAADSG